MERGLVINWTTKKLSSTKKWIKRNSRAISHILLILSFLFSLSAILEHLFLQRGAGASADFIQFWKDISILMSICLSTLWLSSFTVLSFKSRHPYYSHILFVLSFLFFFFAIILRIFFFSHFPLLFVCMSSYNNKYIASNTSKKLRETAWLVIIFFC